MSTTFEKYPIPLTACTIFYRQVESWKKIHVKVILWSKSVAWPVITDKRLYLRKAELAVIRSTLSRRLTSRQQSPSFLELIIFRIVVQKASECSTTVIGRHKSKFLWYWCSCVYVFRPHSSCYHTELDVTLNGMDASCDAGALAINLRSDVCKMRSKVIRKWNTGNWHVGHSKISSHYPW